VCALTANWELFQLPIYAKVTAVTGISRGKGGWRFWLREWLNRQPYHFVLSLTLEMASLTLALFSHRLRLQSD
jgi:hypothetical protein